MTKNLSFGAGYKGYYRYGTNEDRESIAYRPTIDPRKVNYLVDKSLTKDIGLQESLNAVRIDGQNISRAILGLNNISREFLGIAKNRGTEISKQNPSGSKIPIIGVIPTIFRGDFNDKTWNQLKAVENDWKDIKKHYNTQVEKVNNHFMESTEEIARQSKKGMPSAQDKYKTASLILNEKMNTNLTTVSNELVKPTDEIMKTFVETIYDAQQKRQSGRAWRKGLLDMLHAIPVIGTLGAEFGKAAVDAVSDVVTDVAHGHFNDVVHDVVTDFGNINIHDAIHGSNGDIIADAAHDTSFDSLMHMVHGGFDISFGNFDHVDEVFQDFIGSNTDECISNIGDFKNSINWKQGKDMLGKSVFMSGYFSVADTLEHNIKRGKKFSTKDFTKMFVANTIRSPLSMLGEWTVGFYEDLKIKGVPIGKRVENFVKPIGDAPLTPEILKKKTDDIVALLPKQTFIGIQSFISESTGKLLIGKPLSTPDFEKLFKSMDDVLKATNHAIMRR